MLGDSAFRLFLAGAVISALGDSMLLFAAGIWVKQLTGSSGSAGTVYLVLALGGLLSPLYGVLADRVRRGRLIVTVNCCMAAALLPLLLVRDGTGLWIVYAAMALYGIANSVISTTQTALLPSVVPKELLAEANGVWQSAAQVVRLFSPTLGAALLTWAGSVVLVLIDVASSLLGAAVVALLKLREQTPGPGAGHWRLDMTEGARFLVRDAMVRQIAVVVGVSTLAFGFMETVNFDIVDEVLGRDAAFLGVLVTVQSVGAVLGGLLVGRMSRRMPEGMVIATALVARAASTAVLVIPDVLAVSAGFLVAGFLVAGVHHAVDRRRLHHGHPAPGSRRGAGPDVRLVLLHGPTVKWRTGSPSGTARARRRSLPVRVAGGVAG
ncbi:MFS transporter [Streptomyces sp. NPDC001595]|uniref:MFS transporter n=1 Tax=Streptomyces sp. NPDC001532 TaxID=3154520 RepID=UPI00332B602A